jgi:hypothetical protein
LAAAGSQWERLVIPSAGTARTIRYQARLDGRRSRALKLVRHASVTSAGAPRGAVVIAGRGAGSRRKRPVVELLGRIPGGPPFSLPQA